MYYSIQQHTIQQLTVLRWNTPILADLRLSTAVGIIARVCYVFCRLLHRREPAVITLCNALLTRVTDRSVSSC